MCYSPSTAKMFCFACKLFSNSAVKWPSLFLSGFDNWTAGKSRVKMHKSSDGHCKAMLFFASQQSCWVPRCQTGWRSAVLQVPDYKAPHPSWEWSLYKGIKEIKGCAHNGNFLGIIELLVEYDTLLASHIRKYLNRRKSHISYLYSTICEELVKFMRQKVQDTILKEAK